METTFAARLISARKMAGLSLQDLANKLDNNLSKQALNKYEQGKMKPDAKGSIALAKALGISVDYFYSSPKISVQLEDIEFRKYTTKLSKLEDAAIREKAIDGFERYLELEELLQLNEATHYFSFEKPIASAEDCEDAAKQLRLQWELGEQPIPDVVELLEEKGYKVLEVDAPDGFDGMKASIATKKVIVLKKLEYSKNEDIVRKRFTALHELAHHALKFAPTITHKEEEKLCHVFACSVLYPEDIARKELHKERFHFYERELILLKERWGISFPAIFYRANRLGILNDYILKKFTIGYKKRAFHLPNAEPGRYRSKEKPTRLERLVFLGLAKEVLTINEAAYFMGTTDWKLR